MRPFSSQAQVERCWVEKARIKQENLVESNQQLNNTGKKMNLLEQ
jgi:hypothetical protein